MFLGFGTRVARNAYIGTGVNGSTATLLAVVVLVIYAIYEAAVVLLWSVWYARKRAGEALGEEAGSLPPVHDWLDGYVDIRDYLMPWRRK